MLPSCSLLYLYLLHPSSRIFFICSIHFDTIEENHALIDQRVDFVQKLIDLKDSDLIKQKRALLREKAFALQYSLVYIDESSGKVVASEKRVGQGKTKLFDAYDTAIEKVRCACYALYISVCVSFPLYF